jgi:hypothetical protein
MNRYRVAVMLAASLVLAGYVRSESAMLTTVDKLAVVDGNGVVVGGAFGEYGAVLFQGLTGVVFQIDGRFAAVSVLKRTLSGSTQLMFDSADCAGNRFILDNFDPVESAAVGPPGTTLYLADRTAPARSMTIKSRLDWGFFHGRCTNQDLTFDGVLPAVATIDLSTRFTPPFSVRSAGPAATPAPTLSQWAQLMMVALLVGGALWVLRRRAETSK